MDEKTASVHDAKASLKGPIELTQIHKFATVGLSTQDESGVLTNFMRKVARNKIMLLFWDSTPT